MATGSFLLQKLSASAWYLTPDIFQIAQNVLSSKYINGAKILNLHENTAKVESSSYQKDSKMIIPISGVMLDEVGGLDMLCGAYGYNILQEDLQKAYEDDSINHVILKWNSPGGMAVGCERMSNEVRQLATKKRVTSLVMGQMCSAAYYIGSAADEIYASDPLSMVGSIGTYLLHCDQSVKDANEGLKFTFISAGKYKTNGNGHEPLTADSLSMFQELVDNCYSLFLNAVSTNRKLDIEQVKQLAEGKAFTANKAPSGLIDGIATLDEILTWET